jgi:hypothetical protein
MDNPTVILLDTLLGLTVVVPGVAALVGLRARKTPKFKGPFGPASKSKNFDWMEKQQLDAESSTGKVSLFPEAPLAEAVTSKTTVILPPRPAEETPPPIADLPAKPAEAPAERVEPPSDMTVQDEIHIPNAAASAAPATESATLPAPASVLHEEKPVVVVTTMAAPKAGPAAPPAPVADADGARKTIEQIEQQLAFAREMHDRRNEADALAALGAAHLTSGAHRKAITAYEQALAIYRDMHNRLGEADALGNLGLAHEAHGDLFEPIELFEQALLIYRDLGDRRGEASALWTSSLTFNKLGNRSAAVSSAETALRIFEEIADPNAPAVRTQLDEWRVTTQGDTQTA